MQRRSSQQGTALFALAALLACVTTTGPALAAADDTCARLATVALPDTRITSALTVPAGQFAPSAPPAPANPTPQAQAQAAERAVLFRSLPAFCRVTARVTTSPSSVITIDVWLPASGWNGKFLVNGYAFYGNALNPVPLATALSQGYATATTDNGLPPGTPIFDGSFLMGQPERVIDWGERAWHETVVRSKALIAAYYGRSEQRSYFNGAGGAGRQGLKAIQRYPGDFDGVVVGGVAADSTHFALANLWAWLAVRRHAGGNFPEAALPLIHRAAVAACDGDDGLEDGLVSDPERCRFDPGTLQCPAGGAADCLTVGQVAAVRQIYAPPTHVRTGRRLFGPLMPGSELGWAGIIGERPNGYAVEFFRSIVFEDPAWDPLTLNFDSDVDRAEAVPAAVNAVDPDLSAFFARGGKLLMYGGWADTAINPGAQTDYYRSVVERMGVDAVRSSMRVYMLPMMGHFLGGNGEYSYRLDTQRLIEDWIERGTAPGEITATLGPYGQSTRDREVRLCPYPEIALYVGKDPVQSGPEHFACQSRGAATP